MGKQQPSADIGFYSKRIRLLRKILPVIALFLLLALVLAANPDLRSALMTGDNSSGSDTDRLVIDRPQFEGRLADGRRFQMTALTGRQKTDGDIAMQNADILIDGDNPNGRMQLNAAHANYRPGAASARLYGAQQNSQTADTLVTARDALDNVLTGTEMAADLDAGVLNANKVTMTGAAGRIDAAQVTAFTKTKHYRFSEAVMRLKEAAK